MLQVTPFTFPFLFYLFHCEMLTQSCIKSSSIRGGGDGAQALFQTSCVTQEDTSIVLPVLQTMHNTRNCCS